MHWYSVLRRWCKEGTPTPPQIAIQPKNRERRQPHSMAQFGHQVSAVRWYGQEVVVGAMNSICPYCLHRPRSLLRAEVFSVVLLQANMVHLCSLAPVTLWNSSVVVLKNARESSHAELCSSLFLCTIKTAIECCITLSSEHPPPAHRSDRPSLQRELDIVGVSANACVETEGWFGGWGLRSIFSQCVSGRNGRVRTYLDVILNLGRALV